MPTPISSPATSVSAVSQLQMPQEIKVRTPQAAPVTPNPRSGVDTVELSPAARKLLGPQTQGG